jgi:catechol 2,3-dioxygenase-like lactoylglutathione lyase family enzyme
MPLTELNHVTVRTKDMEGTRDFYRRVLGLTVGFRPALSFPGYWLYCGEKAVVHLVPESGQIGAGAGPDTGNFDHVAFAGQDFDGMRNHFKSLGLAFKENVIPDIKLHQLFVADPNGIMLELNFFG